MKKASRKLECDKYIQSIIFRGQFWFLRSLGPRTSSGELLFGQEFATCTKKRKKKKALRTFCAIESAQMVSIQCATFWFYSDIQILNIPLAFSVMISSLSFLFIKKSRLDKEDSLKRLFVRTMLFSILCNLMPKLSRFPPSRDPSDFLYRS